ncbi:MAG: hypothetical protein GF315_02975 [candidate division Zixibacteria bacterium]|nr:hypothetical protein [candidate division Zixibacteria bacterium]
MFTIKKCQILSLAFIALFALMNASSASSDYGASARGTSLGYGFAALADDADGIYYNPAGIGFLKGYQASGAFNRLTTYGMPSDENPFTGFLGGYKHQENVGTFALHYMRFGSLASNTILNTANRFTISYARMINPQLSAGLNAKYHFESNYGKRSAMDFDLGAIYKIRKNFNLGLMVENILQSELSPEYNGVKQYFDRGVRVSALYERQDYSRPTNFVVATGFKNQKLDNVGETYGLGSFGVEQWFSFDNPMSFAVRGSYTITKDYGESAQYLGFGLSFLLKRYTTHWRFDYSYREYPYSGPSITTGNHTLSVIYGFDDNESSIPFADVEEEAPSEEQISKEYADLKAKPDFRRDSDTSNQGVDTKEYVTVPPSKNKAKKMNIQSRVEDLSSSAGKQYMFLMEPGIRFKPALWKLYVHKKRPKPTTLENIEEESVRVFQGSGRVPQVIVWDGKDKEYRICKGGRYYYSMAIWEPGGQLWRTHWYSFRVR